MRILMSLYNTVGKGTYWRAIFLARCLAQSGHEVTVMATSRSQRFGAPRVIESAENLTILETPDLLWGALRSGWDGWNAVNRIFATRNKEFDLVHVFETRPVALLPGLYWQRRGAKLVTDWCDWFGRGGSVEQRPNPLVRSVLRPVETFFENHFRPYADGTTVINSVLYDKARELGISADTIHQLPNGSNTAELSPINKQTARQSLNLSAEGPLIGYVGAIFEHDATLMANAFDRLKQREPGARLVIAGYCNIDLRERVADPQSVIQTGRIAFSEIKTWLSACDLCWLPLCDSSANRGRFPLKLNDYMALGKATIATDVGDMGTFVHDNHIGFVAEDSAESLAEMTQLLWHDTAARMTFEQQAIALAHTKYNWCRISTDLAHFYEDILRQ